MKARTATRSLVALIGFGLAMLAPIAAASGKPDVVIGPIKAHHGFSLTITETDCGPKPHLDLLYVKGSADSVSHEYDGGTSTCNVGRSLGSGSLTGDWAGVLHFKLKLGHAGKLTKGRAPKGCRGSGGEGRIGRATGSLDISIHAGVFGVVRLHKAAALIERFGELKCKEPKPPEDISVVGTFDQGQLFLSGDQPRKGKRLVLLSAFGDNPAAGVTGSMLMSLMGGKSLFDARSDLSSARIGSVAPFTRGAMSFTALPACPGSPNARNGAFSGALTMTDPVLGTITLVGSSAALPFIAIGDAIPGTCNGSP
jgi:hypothetical protein